MQERIVIVTGAGRGMGKVIAQAFADEGSKLMIAARTLSYGEETVAELRAKNVPAQLCQVNVTRREDIEDLIRQTVHVFGGIDVIVHCAAEQSLNPLLQVTDQEINLNLLSGVYAPIWLIQAAYPYLKKSLSGGRVVLISSVCGPRTAISGLTHYGATKAAMNAIIAGAALELAKDGITVNGIEPGFTATQKFLDSVASELRPAFAAKVPVGRIGDPNDIARAVLFLADTRAGYITGRTIVVDGGLTLSAYDLDEGVRIAP